MKKVIALITLLVCMHISSQNSGIIEYSIKLASINNVKIKNTNILEQNKKLEELIIELQFNNTNAYSRLLTPEPINIDDESLIRIASILSGARSTYFTSIKENTIRKETEFIGSLYLISSKINRDDWKISSESTKIGKYNCLKATKEIEFVTRTGKKKKRIQEVWFTPQIPVMFGPKEFVGFPGLVLKAKEGSREYTAKKIILNPSKKITLRKPTKGKKVTAEEFQKIVNEESSFFRTK